MLIQKPSFSVPDAHITVSTFRPEIFSSQEVNTYQTAPAAINTQKNPEPGTATIGAPGIATHPIWKWRQSHLISFMCSWITDVTGAVPNHKLLKKNISWYKSCL